MGETEASGGEIVASATCGVMAGAVPSRNFGLAGVEGPLAASGMGSGLWRARDLRLSQLIIKKDLI